MNIRQVILLIIGILVVVLIVVGLLRVLRGLFTFPGRDQGQVQGEQIDGVDANERVSDSNIGVDLPVAYGEDSRPGFIEGSLSYPDGEVPDQLRVCAEDIITDFLTCTTDKIQDSRFEHGVGYRLEVPPAKYYVYALDEQKNRRGHYIGDCTVDCPDSLQEVIVSSDEVVTGIDPLDWRTIPQE